MSDIWSYSHEWDKGYAKGHKDGYEQGKADTWTDIEKIINRMTNPIDTMKIIIEKLKEQESE